MDLWLDQARTFHQEPFAESVQRGQTGTSFLKMSRPPCAVRVFKDAGKVLTAAAGGSTGMGISYAGARWGRAGWASGESRFTARPAAG